MSLGHVHQLMGIVRAIASVRDDEIIARFVGRLVRAVERAPTSTAETTGLPPSARANKCQRQSLRRTCQFVNQYLRPQRIRSHRQ